MPDLRGSAAYGRIVYTVQESSCSLLPVWIYTHEEFQTRPGERDLRVALGGALDELAQHLERNDIKIKLKDGSNVKIKGTLRELDGDEKQ